MRKYKRNGMHIFSVEKYLSGSCPGRSFPWTRVVYRFIPWEKGCPNPNDLFLKLQV